jgi:outer membrane protein assembly factor BamB
MKGGDDTSPWRQAQWNSIHRDERNSDAVTTALAPRYRRHWRALQGRALLFGPAIAQNGELYACSALGAGHSHLHAFDRNGELRWQSDADDGTSATLGPRAGPFAPLIDATGGIYVADNHAFHCFNADGSTRWRTALRPLGIGEGFASAVFAPSGAVGGISLDGVALFLDRQSGRPSAPPLHVPAGKAPPALPAPPGIWQGLMDPDVAAALYPGFFGTGFAVTNSPAVSLDTGCIYITSAGDRDGHTRLLSLADEGKRLKLRFDVNFSGTCSVTPSVSPDGLTVYTGNHRGELLAFDAVSGELRWSYTPAATAASPTVANDGTVYTGSGHSPGRQSCLSAVNPATGEAYWCRNYESLATERLPERPSLPPFFAHSRPCAAVNSVPTVSDAHLLVVLILGYAFTPPQGGAMVQPHLSVLVCIDRETGDVVGCTDLPDTSESAVVVADDGTVYTPHAALMSSIFARGIDPLLPASHRSPLLPSGGFTAFTPE